MGLFTPHLCLVLAPCIQWGFAVRPGRPPGGQGPLHGSTACSHVGAGGVVLQLNHDSDVKVPTAHSIAAIYLTRL